MSSIITERLAPTSQVKYYDDKIEGLRGIAALSVMLYHGFSAFILDSYAFPIWLKSIPVGSIFVFVFFCLSGYVIGLSHTSTHTFSTKNFLKKRFTRLYPIYILMLSLLLVIPYRYNPLNILIHLLLLQNDWINLTSFKVIPFVAPTWSLNYEIVYYLIFPIIMLYKPKLIYILGTLLLIIFFAFIVKVPVLWDYAFGYIFWISGIYISWNLGKAEIKLNFISYLFITITYWLYLPGDMLFSLINLNIFEGNVGIKSLSFFPLCLLMISDITSRELPYRNIIRFCVFFLPVIIFLIIVNRSIADIWLNERWLMGTICLFLSLLTLKERKIGIFLLKKFVGIGKISYAIYILHFPLAFIIRKWFTMDGNLTIYLVKLTIWIFLTFIISYMIELKMQPYINKRLKILFNR